MHRHRQASFVYAVGLTVQRLDKLGVNHADQIIEGLIRIRDAAEQRNFALAQFLQVQFVCHRQLGDGRQIERGKAHTHADQNGLGGLARNELSRTFLQNKKLSTTLFLGYRKLVLYMYLYIIILQYASYGDSHNLTNRDIILTGKSQKRKLMLSKLRHH